MPFFAFSGSLTRPAPNYGEANGKGITSWHFDNATGRLDHIADLKTIDDPNWLCVDVATRRLYAAGEDYGTDQSWVAAFAIAPDGALTELNRQPTGGQTVCHMSFSPDRRFLFAANYNAGVKPGAPDNAVAVLPIGANGELLPASGSARHEGHGPNPQRQERSHAHCVLPHPNGRFIYVTDLGLDQIVVYGLAADGRLTRASAFTVPPGLGPRHLAITRDGGRLCMVSELIATVISFAVNPDTGALTQLDAFPIAALNGGIVQSSGILFSPDGGHVFAELRQADEIIGLAVTTATGSLRQTYRASSGGKTPRDFCFSPSGRHVLVANQDSDTISVFAMNQSSGTLTGPLHQISTGTPMAVAVVDLPPPEALF